MSAPPITLGNFPLEVLHRIACRLDPRYVHRLSLTSKTFFNNYNNPSYSFAKKNLEWNPDTILDVVAVEAIATDDDEYYDEEGSTHLKTVLYQDMFKLGDHYLAATITNLGLKDSLKLFLDLDFSTLNLNEQDTWLVDFTSSKVQHFGKLLSIVAKAGDLDLTEDNFLVIYFLTAVGDLDTLVVLESKGLLPKDCYQQILTHAIERNHNNIATWILLLNFVDPSAQENKAFVTAVEVSNLVMIETLVQDQRVQSTVDWKAVIVAAIESGQGDNDELLQLIHNKEETNIWTILPNLEPDYQLPFRHAFELLSADWNREQLSPNLEDNLMLFNASISAGSLRMVDSIQTAIDWRSTIYNLRQFFDRAVLYRHWHIVIYFIRQGLFHPSTYISCLKDAVLVNHVNLVKFVIESCVREGYENIWNVVETDVLFVGADAGHLDIVNYVLTLERVNLSASNNVTLIRAVMGNKARVVELLLKSGRLVDSPLPFEFREVLNNTARAWGNRKTRLCFHTLFHEACYLRFYQIVRFFLECRDKIGLDLSNGFAFRMAASLQELDVDDEDGENESDDESTEIDSSEDASEYDDDTFNMDWTATKDDSECARLTFEGDRIALCELLLQTGKSLPTELTNDILKAASSLPFHLFKKVMNQGKYTKDDISDILDEKYDSLKIAIQANQLQVFEYLWSTQDSFEFEVLYSALYNSVLYNRKQFGDIVVKSIQGMQEHYTSGIVWYHLMVDMLGKDWHLDSVLAVWVKMNEDIKTRFYQYVVDKELLDVLEALNKVKVTLMVV
ncbi:hypothetical protein HDU76_006872 [Blyttiomyces sp. JEL0837]|nr:hypothetical protein HDU76_006872 [Blyttiomyces sp. JEL0837]